MIAGVIIWSIVSIIFLIIGIGAWKSEKAVGFYSGVKPPEVSDVHKYNHSVGILWFAYAVLFELLYLPLLFQEQNSAGFLITILGVIVITTMMMIVYNRILRRFQQKQ